MMAKAVWILSHTYKGLIYFDGVYEDKDECYKKLDELVEKENSSTERAKRHYSAELSEYIEKVEA